MVRNKRVKSITDVVRMILDPSIEFVEYKNTGEIRNTKLLHSYWYNLTRNAPVNVDASSHRSSCYMQVLFIENYKLYFLYNNDLGNTGWDTRVSWVECDLFLLKIFTRKYLYLQARFFSGKKCVVSKPCVMLTELDGLFEQVIFTDMQVNNWHKIFFYTPLLAQKQNLTRPNWHKNKIWHALIEIKTKLDTPLLTQKQNLTRP